MLILLYLVGFDWISNFCFGQNDVTRFRYYFNEDSGSNTDATDAMFRRKYDYEEAPPDGNRFVYPSKFTVYPELDDKSFDFTDPQDSAYHHKPNFWTQHDDVPIIIDERSSTLLPYQDLPNRYEEVELTSSPAPTQTPIKMKISDLTKKYLAKILVEKYLSRTTTKPDLKKTSKLQPQDSKFLFNSDSIWELKNKTVKKIKQLFSLFTVVKFNHAECNATNWAGTWQGVCLTSVECSSWNGTALGNCASGFGVCCVFRGTCGDSSSLNGSYFKSPNYPDYYPSNGDVVTPTTTLAPTTFPTPDPRKHWWYYRHTDLPESRQSSTMACTYTVYKTSSDVQQLRIDFIDLDLASPTNGTCTTEQLVISGQNTNDAVPVICGYNSGQHVYVDVSQTDGPVQLMVLSTTGARKRFKIKICQYVDTCASSRDNCLQYYTGTSGVIQTFNYDQAATFNRSVPGYFNNLNYAICIRREAGYCSVTYTNGAYPFQMINSLPNGQLTVPAGQAGVDVLNCPDDYVIIDGTRLCGDRFNDGSTVMNFSVNAPVTDTSTGPIVVYVRSNEDVTGLGFKLMYMQNLCD